MWKLSRLWSRSQPQVARSERLSVPASSPLFLREPTPGEIAEHERLIKAEQARAIKARDRAMALLRRSLTARQNDDLNCHTTFNVTGSAGGQWQIACTTTSGNIELMMQPPGTTWVLGRYCAAPEASYELPPADVWLAQKLAIESDELAFLKAACYYGGTNRLPRVIP